MDESGKRTATHGNKDQMPFLQDGLTRLSANFPKRIRFRLLNVFDHFDRADNLFDVDREMASFRAITGEEEAASLLMIIMQLRKYPDSKNFKVREHRHKAAVIACVLAIARNVQPLLSEFQLIFDFAQKRIDVKLPLTSLGVQDGGQYAIKPTEPLDFIHTRPGIEEKDLLKDAFAELAQQGGLHSIQALVEAQANARNSLLYASDNALPRSGLDRQTLTKRKARAFAMLIVGVMILQSRRHLAMVRQATLAYPSLFEKIARTSIDGP